MSVPSIEKLTALQPWTVVGVRAGDLLNDLAAVDSLTALLAAQREFSERTFGPGPRTKGVVAHIRKELEEIEERPDDVEEWIDAAILAFDGALRTGASPQQVVETLLTKYAKNRAREWPDWRTATQDDPIEHVR